MSSSLIKLAAIGLGGAAGALARYGLAGVVQRMAASWLPWGTFAVNVLGCFAFGLVWIGLERHAHFDPIWRGPLLIGFLGSFTTFSTYIFESGELLRAGQLLAGMGNLALSVAVGGAALAAGVAAGRLI